MLNKNLNLYIMFHAGKIITHERFVSLPIDNRP